MKVDALEGQTFDGEVMEIAQKALIRNQGTGAGDHQLPGDGGADGRGRRAVMPGMSAEVRITAEERDSRR